MKKSFLLLTLGAILEYYDYAIYIYFAKSIGASLIPIHNQLSNIIASFSIFAIGALIRPLGGAIFAHFGDKLGRKNIFVYTILFMAIPTLLIGFIPSFQQIGLLAPLALIILRSIQGFAIGGEIPGSIVFAYELSNHNNKALNTNIVVAGTNIGFFIASLLGAFLLDNHIQQLEPWRVAFIIGGIFGIISYLLRKSMQETPEFNKYVQFVKQQTKAPLLQLWQQSKTNLLKITAIACLLSSSLAVYSFFMPTYLSTYYSIPLNKILEYNSYSLLIFIASALIAGKYHYCFGKKFFIYSIIGFNIVNFILFNHYGQLNFTQIVFIHGWILLYVGIICGRLPVLSASFFPVHTRYSGVALSYNIAFGIVAGTTQVILFSLIKLTNCLWLPAVFILFFSIFAIVALVTTSPRKLVDYV
jgi:MFS family permease